MGRLPGRVKAGGKGVAVQTKSRFIEDMASVIQLQSAIDAGQIKQYSTTMDTWRDILIAEQLPLNGEMVFCLQNGGIGRIFFDGVQVSVSKKSRQALAGFLLSGGIGATATYSAEKGFIIKPHSERSISFHDGIPQHNVRNKMFPWFDKPSELRRARQRTS